MPATTPAPPATTMMTGGDAIVGGLVAHGVDTVFGLPGAQVYGLFDALHRAGVRVVGARHEQGCAYMAFGHARSTGAPAVCAVVPGPGLLNAGAGLLTSYGANAPVLCLTGQVPTAFLGRGHGHLHEMPDQLATARGFTKWAERIESPAQAPHLLARAFQEMTSGRPGPALLEMPWDVFTRTRPVGPAAALPALSAPPVDVDAIAQVVALVAASRAPMIFVGSGAIDAGEEVRRLAERLQAPVVAFRSGRGIVSDAHDLAMTMVAAHQLWPETDLAVAVGTRAELPRWRWPRDEGKRSWVRIDIDPVEARRFPTDVDITADAGDALRALLDALQTGPPPPLDRLERIRGATATARAAIEKVQPQVDFLTVLRDVLPDEAIVTDELSQVGFASWFAFPVHRPRTFLSSGYQGTLGSGFPTALGAKVAHPDTPVVAICGDGGFLFAVAELATAVQYGIDVIVLVFNNASYGNVRRDQQRDFGGRLVGADLHNPDLVRLARSFGLEAARVRTPAALRRALDAALAAGGPHLVEISVPVGTETNPWPLIQPSA